MREDNVMRLQTIIGNNALIAVANKNNKILERSEIRQLKEQIKEAMFKAYPYLDSTKKQDFETMQALYRIYKIYLAVFIQKFLCLIFHCGIAFSTTGTKSTL